MKKSTEKQTFSIQQALAFGWNTTIKNRWFLIAFFLLVIGVYVAQNFILKQLVYYLLAINVNKFAVLSLISIISLSIFTLIFMGIIKISLRFCNHEKGLFSDLIPNKDVFFRYFACSILYRLILFMGTLLLVVPAIIWALKFGLFGYCIVEKGMGPIEALKKSASITMGSKWRLFLFSIVAALINIAGALCLGVGLLITLPMTSISIAFIYRRLSEIAEENRDQSLPLKS